MKAALVLDQFADLSAVTEEQREKLAFRPGYKGKAEAVFPAGTIFEGEQALMLCRTGQATPVDDECAKEVGLTSRQLISLQLGYKMDSLGINRKEDRELYRAGVITGYDEDMNYIHGPKWGEYQAAKVTAATASDDI